MTTFQWVLLLILVPLTIFAVRVLYRLATTLEILEKMLREQVSTTLSELQIIIADVHRVLAAVEHNVERVNETFGKLGENLNKVADMFQSPWAKLAGVVVEAVNLVKKFRSK